jgi:DNA-binding protein HU-beta
MNQSELVAHVAAAAGLSKADAGKAVEAVFADITDALKKGEEARFIGFGTFKVSETAAREGRNPRTGEVIQIGAGKAPKFSAGKELKDAMNG